MRRIALFTEGQTEQIFVRECLLRLFDLTKLSFECWELLAHKLHPVPYRYPNLPNPDAEIFFMIINVHGDEGVMSSIKERERNLIEKGQYEKIVGLRDMYSQAYDKLAQGDINDSISKQFIQSHNLIIKKMTYCDRIRLYFAIMEIEAWILGMYNLFQKIDPALTTNYVRQGLDIDLKTIDPQKAFYQPSNQLNSILLLCGQGYNKKKSDIESICSVMELTDLKDAIRDGRCGCFDEFYHEIMSSG